jgi:predicted TIM-barrel fold metal-dependent hydrolase
MTTTDALKLFSADSHVVEPDHCFRSYIEAKYRDRAPRLGRNESGGEVLILEEHPPLPVVMLASCGSGLKKADFKKATVAGINPGAFDPKRRLLDQDRDGVVGEVIYPSIGMVVCGLTDVDFKQACMSAYNRWLHDEFTSHAPDRLLGIGQTSVRSVPETIKDLQTFRDMGFKGVMMPAEPSMDQDYDDKIFDPLWSAAVELDMPLSFHVVTSRETKKMTAAITGHEKSGRGPSANQLQHIIRVNQDIIGMFIWSGIFERHPKLKLVCVEAEASWAPHLMHQMDRFATRPTLEAHGALKEKPSHYFRKNVHLTFQEDWVAFELLRHFDPNQLMWANDFPHPDGIWPRSQELLAEHGAQLTPEQRQRIVRGNIESLYGLN